MNAYHLSHHAVTSLGSVRWWIMHIQQIDEWCWVSDPWGESALLAVLLHAVALSASLLYFMQTLCEHCWKVIWGWICQEPTSCFYPPLLPQVEKLCSLLRSLLGFSDSPCHTEPNLLGFLKCCSFILVHLFKASLLCFACCVLCQKKRPKISRCYH